MTSEASFAGRVGRSSANKRREQLVGIVDPHERYAMLVGAVEDVAKLNLHGRV